MEPLALAALAVSAFGIFGAWIIKKYIDKVDRIEKELSNAITERDLRTILDDKIEPIKEIIEDIKQSITLLTEAIINVRKHKH